MSVPYSEGKKRLILLSEAHLMLEVVRYDDFKPKNETHRLI